MYPMNALQEESSICKGDLHSKIDWAALLKGQKGFYWLNNNVKFVPTPYRL